MARCAVPVLVAAMRQPITLCVSSVLWVTVVIQGLLSSVVLVKCQRQQAVAQCVAVERTLHPTTQCVCHVLLDMHVLKV